LVSILGLSELKVYAFSIILINLPNIIQLRNSYKYIKVKESLFLLMTFSSVLPLFLCILCTPTFFSSFQDSINGLLIPSLFSLQLLLLSSMLSNIFPTSEIGSDYLMVAGYGHQNACLVLRAELYYKRKLYCRMSSFFFSLTSLPW
jgi:hypothetical protein